jgi:hypothetical protein
MATTRETRPATIQGKKPVAREGKVVCMPQNDRRREAGISSDQWQLLLDVLGRQKENLVYQAV